MGSYCICGVLLLETLRAPFQLIHFLSIWLSWTRGFVSSLLLERVNHGVDGRSIRAWEHFKVQTGLIILLMAVFKIYPWFIHREKPRSIKHGRIICNGSFWDVHKPDRCRCSRLKLACSEATGTWKKVIIERDKQATVAWSVMRWPLDFLPW